MGTSLGDLRSRCAVQLTGSSRAPAGVAAQASAALSASAVVIRPAWLKTWDVLPRWRPVVGSYS